MKQPPRMVVLHRQDVDKAVRAIFAHVPQRSPVDEAADIFERLRASPPKQERSLQTLNRLLDAAERVLEDDGLEAATVPAIARRAGVSVGVVYRRFPNKDALIRGVYERYLWRAGEQNSMMLTTLSRVNVSAEELVRGMIRGAVEGYRRKRKLVLALIQYAQKHPDIKRRTGEINRASTAALTALLLSHSGKISHPDPEEAIRFSMLTLAAVIRSVIIDEEGTHGLRAPDDLEGELTGMIFSYLGLR
ncbi:MAG TPA: TetR family transcriptional regulator [Thermoanaerobaculia bacterium]|nr:TetR family transcriptional regulator [Thermoanaerobaculia bacterium]